MRQRRLDRMPVSGNTPASQPMDDPPRGASHVQRLPSAGEGGAILPARLERGVEIDLLRGHEKTQSDHLDKLSHEIRMDGFLRRPIVVDLRTKVILDGHHRVAALRSLGCSKTPVYFVDYSSPLIEVRPWREGEKVTKETVLNAGLRGPKLPPKTTKHVVKMSGSFCHITAIQRELNVPLDELRPTGRRERHSG